MMIVGCDLGLTNTGIVVLDDKFNIQSQTLIQAKSRAAQRLVDIERAFDALITPYLTDLTVFVEGYAYGAKYQKESLAELGGVMRYNFHTHKLNYWVIPPLTLKSFVTGSAKASKNYMKKCTKDKWGLSFKSDDVCDAHGLARLGITTLCHPDMDLDESERAVVDELLSNRMNYLNANTAKRKKK